MDWHDSMNLSQDYCLVSEMKKNNKKMIYKNNNFYKVTTIKCL
jgi:hypothetical protein